MNIEEVHIHHCMLHYFHRGKISTEATRIICKTYGDNIVSEKTYQDWFKRFKSDFDER